MIIYLLLGLAWTGWLEYYTTSYLEDDMGSAWSMKERFFQCFLWPINLLIFLIALFRGQ